MYILIWILVGGLIGWIASMITRNNSQMGVFANIIVGLLGAVLGGFISYWLNIGTYKEFSFMGLLMALLGSVIILLIVNMFKKRTE